MRNSDHLARTNDDGATNVRSTDEATSIGGDLTGLSVSPSRRDVSFVSRPFQSHVLLACSTIAAFCAGFVFVIPFIRQPSQHDIIRRLYFASAAIVEDSLLWRFSFCATIIVFTLIPVLVSHILASWLSSFNSEAMAVLSTALPSFGAGIGCVPLPNQSPLTVAGIYSFTVAFCIVATGLAALINILPSGISDSNYFFCLFILLSNGVYLKIINMVIRKYRLDVKMCATPRCNRPSKEDRIEIIQYRTNVHFTIAYICFSLITRTYRDAIPTIAFDQQTYDMEFRGRLADVNFLSVFFVCSAVLISRFLSLLCELWVRIASKHLTSSIAPMWMTEIVKSIMRSSSADFWFALFVLYAFAFAFGVIYPIVALFACLGILFEFAVQRIRTQWIGAAPVDATSFVAWQLPSDVRCVPLYTIATTLLVGPYKTWVLMSIAAALGCYVLAILLSNVILAKARLRLVVQQTMVFSDSGYESIAPGALIIPL